MGSDIKTVRDALYAADGELSAYHHRGTLDRAEAGNVSSQVRAALRALTALREELKGMERERDACCDDYQRAAAEAEALRGLLKEAREALIVLNDDTWNVLARLKPDDADLYSWTVGDFRRMREAARRIDAALSGRGGGGRERWRLSRSTSRPTTPRGRGDGQD